MRTTSLALALVVLVLPFAAVAAEWTEDLDALLAADPGPERDAVLDRIVAASPDWREVVDRIDARAYPPVSAGLTRETVAGIDGVDRPWVLCVPEDYDPARPTPLLVVMHGLVSRPEVMEDPVGYAQESPFRALAGRNGWIAAFPMGQEGATWWDEVGMTNVRRIVRAVKRRLNVDDDRVSMIGFSDGASAGLLHAMTVPTDYAAFVSLNGHMGTGAVIGEMEIYANNMANSPLWVVTTDRDPIFPTAEMAPHVEMARRAGADIVYRQHEGLHEFSYADVELPLLERFLRRHVRDPIPTRIDWESAGRRFGRCRWFEILEVGDGEAAPWHVDHNAVLVDDRVSIGFWPDEENPSEDGIAIGRVVEDTFAERVGLRPGDVLLAANGTPTPDLDALNAFKATVRRGDAVTLAVRRGEETLELPGRLPDVERSWLFPRRKPSARARVSFCANRVDVTSSRLAAFRILVHPDLFETWKPIRVDWNGRVAHTAIVSPDVRFLLENFLEDRDRRNLPVAEIRIGVK